MTNPTRRDALAELAEAADCDRLLDALHLALDAVDPATLDAIAAILRDDDAERAEPAGDAPTFNRFDIAEAHYIYAHDYGEYATITRLRDRLRLKPAPTLTGRADLTTNGKAIYDRLAEAAR